MSGSPFDDDYIAPEAEAKSHDDFLEDFGRTTKTELPPPPPGFRNYEGGLITEPGAYIGLPISSYHGAEICDGPSISSTGLKKLVGRRGKRSKGISPRHFWEGSNMNPNRKKLDTDALRLGRAFHDAVLMPDDWQNSYYRLPEGFNRAASKAQADAIAEADAAIESGLCVVSHKEAALIEAMAAAVRADDQIAALLTSGLPEVTLVWKDEATGVWCRARPDFILTNQAFALNLKSDTDASWDGFSSSISKYGYHQSAALELAGYEAVFGKAPPHFFHPCVEKPTLANWTEGDWIPTALWRLPDEDIERGKHLNKVALRTFADCLAADRWPGYTPDPEDCGLQQWARKICDEGGQGEPHSDEPAGAGE